MEINWMRIMKFKWFRRFHVLYVFGFAVGFRPSTPFLYEFFTDFRRISKNETFAQILPISFYSAAVQCFPVLLLVDFFRYNPIVILGPLTGIAATCLLIWTDRLTEFQVAQAFFGSVGATEIAYYSSVYAHSNVKTFQQRTSFIRAAPLFGKTLSNFLGQLLISNNWVNYRQLLYFDLSAFVVAAILSIFLAPEPPDKLNEEAPREFSAIFSNFGRCFPNKYVVKWSIWTMLTICAYNQVMWNVQALRNANEVGSQGGTLEGLYALFALIATILGGFAAFDWKFKGDLLLSMTSLVQTFMMFFVSQLDDPLFNALFYVIFGFIYSFISTILNAEIAKFLKKGSFGMIFGFIAFGGSGLSSAMVYCLNVRFSLEIHNIFMVYGFYYLILAGAFIVVGLTYWFAKHTYH